ncbi:MAG: SMP-30/gluconolactonase/LRE family protein [Candidatus Aquicultorales bacterium]
MKKRTLIARIITLLVAMGGLLYLYTVVNQPPGGEGVSVENLRLLWTLYGRGNTAEQLLNRPHAVAADKEGNIYVADTANQQVLVFDRTRRFLKKLDPGYDPKQKKTGLNRGYLAVAVADDGRIYIADKLQSKIFILDKNGRTTGQIDEMSPTALTVAGNKLYAATYGHVVVYDLKGRELKKLGRRGAKPGEFDFPGGIAVDKKGNIYVSDSNNTRLVALDKDGNTLWTVGKKSASMNEKTRKFGLPAGLAMDDNDILYVVDAFNGSIFAFNANGKQLAEIGEWGQKEGQFYYPSGIAFAGNHTLIVADEFNDRVQAVELTVPGVPGSSVTDDAGRLLMENPTVGWVVLSFAFSVCLVIIWIKLRTMIAKPSR